MSLYRTKVALSIKGERIERNTEVELRDEDVAHLDPSDIERVSDAPAAEAAADQKPVSIEEMTGAQLKEKAKELGLKTSGSVADLRERITLHLQGEVATMVDFEVTEDYLVEHPELVDQGVKVGDTIKVPEEKITNE